MNTSDTKSDIYVVGCGPSLKGFEWARLRDRTTIAVNGAVIDVPNADYFITADSRFARLSWTKRFWNTPAQRVLVMKQDHRSFHRVRPLLPQWDWHIVPARFDGQIGLREEDFSTGQNSGFCGMQLAVILGASRIHLLGLDFHTQGGEHYHSLYSAGLAHLDEFYQHFQTAIRILQKHDRQVINHSPTSRLVADLGYQEDL